MGHLSLFQDSILVKLAIDQKGFKSASTLCRQPWILDKLCSLRTKIPGGILAFHTSTTGTAKAELQSSAHTELEVSVVCLSAAHGAAYILDALALNWENNPAAASMQLERSPLVHICASKCPMQRVSSVSTSHD